ncbi:MAG: MBL fold metallo-hydrolase, partial [Deferribacterota bacterium]|nr:MBL fold metallo-hydrolase [Deferribacterota bacterium]
TPGHAIHHLAYMVDGAVICGDIGGVRFNKGPAIPPCPPPDINIKDWIHSIERLSALRLSKLFLTHFGPFDDVQEHLAALKGRLISYTRFIREGMKGGLTQQELIDRFEEFFREEFKSLHLNEEMLAIYELTNPPWTNVLGLVRYLQKKKEAL